MALAKLYPADAYKSSGTKQRLIGEFQFGAKSWGCERRIASGWSTMPTAPISASSSPA